MTKDGAVSMITRGFVSIDIPGLPDVLRRQIDKAIEDTSKVAMWGAAALRGRARGPLDGPSTTTAPSR
jgi:hypothetical protein